MSILHSAYGKLHSKELKSKREQKEILESDKFSMVSGSCGKGYYGEGQPEVIGAAFLLLFPAVAKKMETKLVAPWWKRFVIMLITWSV